MSLKLSCTAQFHLRKAGCFHFKEAPVFVNELRVSVRKMLLQLIRIHGSIREGFETNETLGQLLITSLYESESIVEKSIDIFSLSFSHSFLCHWKFHLTKHSSCCSTLTLTIHSALRYRALRSILGIHWRDLVSNETVRALAGQPLASSLAARRRVRWCGHVLRLPPHHPSRAILDFNPGSFGWKRSRGAPRTRWFDVVKRDHDQLGLDPAAIGGEVEIVFLTESESSHSGGWEFSLWRVRILTGVGESSHRVG